MRYYVLLVLIACASYATASVVTALASAVAWPRVRRRVTDAASSQRARVIAALRLAPVTAGLASATILSAAFIRFEPANTTEDPGLLLAGLAALTVGLVIASAARATRAMTVAAECARLLRSCGRRVVRGDGTTLWIVDTEYPVAAVTGVFRTRLLLSTRIVNECTPGELDAVVRHETAHVRRRDNLVRAAMLYLPDPLAYVPAGLAMQQAWAGAAEESADDAAAGDKVEHRTVLASALVRVAAMATSPVPRWMPALAFYEGTNLENRVRRLLESGRLANRFTLRAVGACVMIAAAFVLALTEPVARELHVWMEVAVHVVP